ncbi:hypothetical protein I3760_04G146700 [Carya illinoinensis]|nr:hypothetical protein I3760_04G146700 [Carya illinoinensis]
MNQAFTHPRKSVIPSQKSKSLSSSQCSVISQSNPCCVPLQNSCSFPPKRNNLKTTESSSLHESSHFENSLSPKLQRFFLSRSSLIPRKKLSTAKK